MCESVLHSNYCIYIYTVVYIRTRSNKYNWLELISQGRMEHRGLSYKFKLPVMPEEKWTGKTPSLLDNPNRKNNICSHLRDPLQCNTGNTEHDTVKPNTPGSPIDVRHQEFRLLDFYQPTQLPKGQLHIGIPQANC